MHEGTVRNVHSTKRRVMNERIESKKWRESNEDYD